MPNVFGPLKCSNAEFNLVSHLCPCCDRLDMRLGSSYRNITVPNLMLN